MSYDSAPAIERAPTFDEVVEYAVNNGIFGKISLTKFCDYYGDFMYKGRVMNWKAKLHQWADSQSSKPVISEKEYEAQRRIQARKEKATQVGRVVDDLWAKVAMI